tara:strand:- start:807 stop:1163 length:357 start_codon:yes stop_codon:yes gene_type:complete
LGEGIVILDNLGSVAKELRFRKEKGEFKTYRDAYRWAVKNIHSRGLGVLTVQRLEKAYHKAKSNGKIGVKKLSIPIMITNKMRTDLSVLGYTKDEIKYLTPEKCWKIINTGVPKKLTK